jgi:hypothetical protein
MLQKLVQMLQKLVQMLNSAPRKGDGDISPLPRAQAIQGHIRRLPEGKYENNQPRWYSQLRLKSLVPVHKQ